jgi:DNA mismatch endonuclease (patch repair protein)
MHPKLPGSPDILISRTKTLIFVDGCFWHGCKKHGSIPKSRKEYWGPKIKGNVARDSANRRELKRMGYNVLRIWEHQANRKSFDAIIFLKKRKAL